MKVTYDIAWRVWYIKAFGQWVVHPPDGFYKRGEFTFLTNVQPNYYRLQKDAWNIAKQQARKHRTLAVIHYKAPGRWDVVDYRSSEDKKNEEVQATECPKHLYP